MNAVTETKPEHGNIAAAMIAAQLEMGKAIKQSNNPHFKSKYADLGNVMDACLPALNKHGIAVIQPTGSEGDERFVETVFLHTSGEKMSCRVPLIVAKNDMQGYGSAVTYARRYGLMCMAGIAPEDDDGNAAAKAPPQRQERQQRNTGPDPIQIAIDSLNNAQTLDALAAIWKGENFPRSNPDVIDAKEARKAALSQPADSVTDDMIPY